MGIRLLEPSLVQRIAAGEVIERPSSVLRELLDNSLDAGAGNITVWVEGGGIDRIIVADDGGGMAPEDLEKACQAHATSKISTLDDLFKIRTMGFRGEALYSIAACSRLSISSNGKRRTVDNTEDLGMEDDFSVPNGTRVVVENLFGKIPARKLFLKRASAEAASCRNILLEKALAFPSVAFKLFQDGQLRTDLPAAEPKRRVLDALSTSAGFVASDAEVFAAQGEAFSLYGVGTTAASYRSDRSQIRIFVNKHAVEDPSLLAAVVNGYSERFPGGRFPYFCLFLTIDPELVDFNVHPAKRECRIRIKAQVASLATTMIRGGLKRSIRMLDAAREVPSPPSGIIPSFASEAGRGYGGRTGGRAPSGPGRDAPPAGGARRFDSSWFGKAKEAMGTAQERLFEPPKEREYRYIGQAFRLFLVAERDGRLLFVDQHAAHERILYDEFRRSKQVQRLLIPYRFPVERDADAFLLENSHIYADWGVELTRPEELLWEIGALPAISKGAEEKIARFVTESAGDLERIERSFFSTLACKAAIKAGDEVDTLTALALLDKVFLLEKPCCPHGRTFVAEITEQSLREAVGRFG